MNSRPLLAVVVLAGTASLLLSCGGDGNTDCRPIALTISPASGSADHTAVPPGNQVQFSGMAQYPGGCVVPALLPVLTWSTSDTIDTSIGNVPETPGLATCINTTSQPATITGSLPGGSLKGTATLACK